MPININPFESNPGWDLIRAIYSYYGLKDYVEFWYYDHFDRDRIKTIEAYNRSNKPGDKFFWNEVMAGNILNKDKIRLLNFQISPWFPRKPGLFWTHNAVAARKEAFRNHVEYGDKQGFVFDVYGKTLMTELGGIGTVNFRKDREFVLITATSSGVTEEGIPIICRQNVWEQIEREYRQGNRIEVDLQGTLVNINRENDSYFLRSSLLPKIAILVNSLLNVQIKSSSLDIRVSPWTIFETHEYDRPYGFTYVTHTLFEDEIENSNNWINYYVESHAGKAILTDFDENQNYLNAIFPLNDTVNGTIMSTRIMEYTQKIYRDFKKRR